MSSAEGKSTVLDLLNKSARYLASKGSRSPRLDAEVLLAGVLGCSRIQLYVGFDRGLSDAEVDSYREAVMRRGRREPVAYITGRKEFMGRDFSVGRGVLVPRPETELLAEKAIEALVGSECANAAEICCGTGAAGITVALEVPGIRMFLSDISDDALETASKNVMKHGLKDRVSVLRGDLLAALPDELKGKLDLVMANPPYIRTGDIDALEPEVSEHEPRMALDGGSDGLLFYRRIAPEAALWLKQGGTVLMEVGYDQAGEVSGMLGACGFGSITSHKDLQGYDRVVVATL